MRTDRNHSHHAPSPVAPATGRIFRDSSLEEGRRLPRHRRGTRFPGRRDLAAKYVQPRDPRHGEFPAAFTVGLPAEALAQAGHRPPATGLPSAAQRAKEGHCP